MEGGKGNGSGGKERGRKVGEEKGRRREGVPIEMKAP